MDVYLEIGKKKTFASAIGWPGWCRSGRDEQSALLTLGEYGSRYADVLRQTSFGFRPPADVSVFKVIQRIPGNVSTDFGAPGKIPTDDLRPLEEADLQRFQKLLSACWQTFDAAVRTTIGKELRKGPRGGGRDLEAIVNHEVEADAAYLRKVGGKFKKGSESDPNHMLSLIRQAVFDALASAARGELPDQGPRGGKHWPARYFVRRVAWHVLDHAWEIEDRLITP